MGGLESMTGGFGAILDELHQTASRIADVVTGVDGLPWEGPSGDYGNPGVQTGWAQFIENAKTQINGLWEQANGHGDLLRTAAGQYQASDDETSQTLSGIGSLLEGAGPAGVAGAIGGAAGSGIAATLNPDVR